MGPREIYKNPPLALSVVELRHTVTPPLSDADQAALKAALSEQFPLAKPARRGVSVNVGPAGISQEPVLGDPRFMSRDTTAAVTFRTNAIAVETTRYARRSSLRELLRQAVEARQKIAPADGIERLGVRYINEVRAPGIDSAVDWTQWITAPLAGPAGLAPDDTRPPQSWQGMSVFGTSASGVVLRHGTFNGYAVDPVGDLRRTTPPPGPYYLLDLDSFWEPAEEKPTLDWENIEERFNETALAAYTLFEQLITDGFREEVLRRGQ